MPRSPSEFAAAASPHHGYDPNQLRVPAGLADGGRWTNGPGGGAPTAPQREVTVDRTGKESWGSFVNTYRPDGSVEQRVFNRDGSRIVSEFKKPGGPGDWDERHTVVMRDGEAQGFGTEVHKRIAREINGTKLGTDEFRSPSDPLDPDFRAEFLAHKKMWLMPTIPRRDTVKKIRFASTFWRTSRTAQSASTTSRLASGLCRPCAWRRSRDPFIDTIRMRAVLL
jgi:hypothetical protein